mmetsp:Transcript_62050/g.175517  ORF Transcript_62050/g.175517 Transcript_62050/m.175517 type:complete len:243 (-) Transcript_62050:1750-2478(-)
MHGIAVHAGRITTTTRSAQSARCGRRGVPSPLCRWLPLQLRQRWAQALGHRQQTQVRQRQRRWRMGPQHPRRLLRPYGSASLACLWSCRRTRLASRQLPDLDRVRAAAAAAAAPVAAPLLRLHPAASSSVSSVCLAPALGCLRRLRSTVSRPPSALPPRAVVAGRSCRGSHPWCGSGRRTRPSGASWRGMGRCQNGEKMRSRAMRRDQERPRCQTALATDVSTVPSLLCPSLRCRRRELLAG